MMPTVKIPLELARSLAQTTTDPHARKELELRVHNEERRELFDSIVTTAALPRTLTLREGLRSPREVYGPLSKTHKVYLFPGLTVPCPCKGEGCSLRLARLGLSATPKLVVGASYRGLHAASGMEEVSGDPNVDLWYGFRGSACGKNWSWQNRQGYQELNASLILGELGTSEYEFEDMYSKQQREAAVDGADKGDKT